MSKEFDIIQRTPEPRTRSGLAKDFMALGVTPGMTAIVHIALSSLGWVNGGAVAVIQALMDALTPEGTLVMPAHSGDLSDPSFWGNPPVPEPWLQTIRDTMPAFEPAVTPTRGIGTVPEVFRKFPGVLRSDHPAVSFTAWGKHAPFVTAYHGLEYSLGDNSPLARIYDLDGHILLIGVGHDKNTSLHLAEYRSNARPPQSQGAPMLIDGKRVWMEYTDLEIDSEAFPDIGLAYEQAHSFTQGRVGSAECKLLRQRELVDFATGWFRSRSGIG